MTQPKKRGRPIKYRAILDVLADDQLYTAASISRFAVVEGLLQAESYPALERKRLRLRIAMGRRIRVNAFPKSGDGELVLPGQMPVPAWFGWRWKKGKTINGGTDNDPKTE